MFSLYTKLRFKDEVVYTELYDEVVIMNIIDGRYYSLNSVGSAVWKQLTAPKTISSLCAYMEQKFEVTAEVCRTDVLLLAEQLYNVGLIDIVE